MRCALSIVVFALSLPLAAAAQAPREGFALDRHRPPPTNEDGLRLERPWTLGHSRWSAQLVADYAHAPLVLSEQTGDGRDEVGAIVAHRVLLHALFAVGIGDRAQAHVGFPIALAQSGSAPTAMGETFAEPAAPALGDPWVGGSVRLTGAPPRDEPAGLGVSLDASLLLPVGSEERLASDGGIGARVGLAGAFETARITPIAVVGVAIRPSRTYLSTEVGTELTFGLGAHVPLSPVELMIEIAGTTTLIGGQAFSREGTALEALLGARYLHTGGITLGGAAGLGLVDALGVPDVRGLVLLGFAPPVDEPVEVAEVPEDDVELAVDTPRPVQPAAPPGGAPAPSDRDGDGIADDADECPTEPEVVNGMRDEDGCPEPGRVTETHIEVDPPVRFARRSAEIRQQAGDSLWLVGELLRARTDLTVIQVEGHAAADDGRGRRALAISERRAAAVVRFLVEAGVHEDRLIAVGVGSDRPLDVGDDADNRRVTLRIVERAQ
jgi:outer membrane protein OmpA-like peptidoglycan-associated protein